MVARDDDREHDERRVERAGERAARWERAKRIIPIPTPSAYAACRDGTAATGFESAEEVGEPMSIPESISSVSSRPTPASRGGAVG